MTGKVDQQLRFIPVAVSRVTEPAGVTTPRHYTITNKPPLTQTTNSLNRFTCVKIQHHYRFPLTTAFLESHLDQVNDKSASISLLFTSHCVIPSVIFFILLGTDIIYLP